MGMTDYNKPYHSRTQETCLPAFVLHLVGKGDLHCHPWCECWVCHGREGDLVSLLGAMAPQWCASLTALLSAPHTSLREYISFLLCPCHSTLLLSLPTASIPSWIKVWLHLAESVRRMLNLHAARNEDPMLFHVIQKCVVLNVASFSKSCRFKSYLRTSAHGFLCLSYSSHSCCTASNIACMSRSPKGMQGTQRMKSKLSLFPVILISWA